MIDENGDSSADPAAKTVAILDELATLLKADDQTQEEFNLQVFTEFTSGGFDPVEPGYALPR